jgi:hypothetical protein
MVIFIETKFTLEIAKRFWLSQDYNQIQVPIYVIKLSDQRSNETLAERRVHQDEILNHVEDMLPLYYNQIKNQIVKELNLN